MSENVNRRGGSSLRGQAILAAAVLAWGATAYGQNTPEVIWDGGSAADDKYVTPDNWNPDVTPTNFGNHFVQINDGSTALVQAGDAAEGAFLMLGMRPGDTGTLDISGGTLTVGEMRVGGRETINNNLADWTMGTFEQNGGGTGTVNQTGGNVFVNYSSGTEPPIQSLYIGDASLASGNTARGTYNISGGTLTVGIAANDAIVIGTGAGTIGAFNQSGASAVTSTGFVTVGRASASATYTLDGGTLNVGTGALTADQNLRVGDGGEYPSASTIFHPGTTGAFNHNAGTVTVANDGTIGRNSGTGAYTIKGTGSTLNVNNNLNVGHGGTGTVVQGELGQPGPTVNIGKINTGTRGMSVGISGTSTLPGAGTYTLRSGLLDIGNTESADYLAVGDGVFGTGTFNMDGGSITVSDLVQVGRNNSANDNVFNMNAGTITSKRMVIGGGSGATGGRGTFIMTGGTYTGSEATNIGFGGNNGTSVGTLDIRGGTYTLPGAGALGIMAVGNTLGNTGNLLVSGGTVSVEGTGSVIDLGRNNASGSLTLSGTGTLKAALLRGADRSAGTGTRTITFDGGTSTITTLTLGNVGVMTVNGGTHTIANTNFSTGSTFTANADLSLPVVAHGTSTINVGPGATLSLGNSSTAAVPPRTITKGGAGTLAMNGTQAHGAGTVLANTAGVVNLNADGGSGLGVNTNAATTNFGAAQNLREVGVSGGGTVNVGANNVSTTGAVTLTDGTINGTTGVVTGNSYDVRKGSVTALLGGAGALTKSTADTVTLTRSNSYTGGTNVQAGTLQVARMHEGNPVNITGGKLQVLDSSPTLPLHPSGDNAFVSRPSALTIANNGGALGARTYNGQLDLGNNDLILDYDGASPIADVEDMVRAGYNGGDWTGNGITSSTANANRNFAVGIADNSRLTIQFNAGRPFSGQTVDSSTILVKFTHRIDLDLDGVITTNDATIFNSNYSEGAPAYWSIGDVDYDRVFTSNDATIFNGFYSEALASVPEPAAVGVLAIGALGLLGRRRRGA